MEIPRRNALGLLASGGAAAASMALIGKDFSLLEAAAVPQTPTLPALAPTPLRHA